MNRIAGRTLGGFGVVDGDDTDYLYFYVPEGYTLDSFTLRSSMNVSGSNLAANFMYSIYDCATVDCSGPSGGWALNAVQSVELDVLGERLYESVFAPLASGFYALAMGRTYAWSGISGVVFDQSYTWELTVSANSVDVPEPGTLGLALVSLFGVALARRRRQSQE